MAEQTFTSPLTTVDVVLMTIDNGKLCVLLHKREQEPFMGAWALPGGWVRTNEDATVEETGQRVLRDKAGMPAYHLEQLAVFSGADRDPRGWSVSIALLALVPHEELAHLDPLKVRLVPVEEAQNETGAFDHGLIISTALERLRGKSAYSTLPASLLVEGFSMSQLQAAYEIITGSPLSAANFRRKVLDLGFIEETGEKQIFQGAKRPAALYRLTERGRTFNRLLTAS